MIATQNQLTLDPAPYVPRTVLVSPIFGTGPRYKAPARQDSKSADAAKDKVSFANVGFIFGAAQGDNAQNALDPSDERIPEMLARLTVREHGLLLAHVAGQSYGAMARASGLARSTATLAVQRVCEKLEEHSPESLRARWQAVIDSIDAAEYERLYAMPKEWWTHKDPFAIASFMRRSPTSSNQHIKRFAAANHALSMRAA